MCAGGGWRTGIVLGYKERVPGFESERVGIRLW